MRRLLHCLLLAAVLACLPADPAFSQRTPLKPSSWNLFSAQEEVELGRQVSANAEKQLPMLNDSRVDDYLNRLGKRLAANAQGEKYPYQFRCVNDASINAFALPGGFLFVNRGTIEAADNEAELAGVIGHEIGHVALRHGTNQATKQYAYQGGAAVALGLLFGKKNSAGALIAQLGTGFALNSVLLKYSRDDERQADLFGAQLLYDSNYDPAYLSTFFEKLETKGRGTDFFSSHPNPENRIKNIDQEIRKLGSQSAGRIQDSREFQTIKKYVKSLPPAPKKRDAEQSGSTGARQGSPPAKPSSRYLGYDAGNMTLRYPDNWRAYGENNTVTLAPEGGIVQAGNGEGLAYGAMMRVYKPDYGTNLKNATDQLVRELQKSNPGMRLSKDQGQIRVGGQAAVSRLYSNNSALGGRELNWIIAVLRPEGLVYFIFVSPEEEFGDYQRSFQQIVNSVSFK